MPIVFESDSTGEEILYVFEFENKLCIQIKSNDMIFDVSLNKQSSEFLIKRIDEIYNNLEQ